MKYRLVLVLVLAALAGHSSPANSRTWYVSPGGNDDNPGTRARPFATPGRALAASRSQPEARARSILLATGTYLGCCLELGSEDNGLTIAAQPGARPVLIGGLRLRHFQPDGPQLWTAQLPPGASADFRMLVINGRLAERARFPATGSFSHLSDFPVPWMGTYGGGWKRKPTHEELTTLRVRPEEPGPFFEPTNAELTIYHEWDESLVGVRSYDGQTGTVTFTTETGHPPGAFGNHRYVIWNTRDGMTRPGQWYVERAERRVVYWPLPGEEPERLEALFPTTQSVIRITGSTEAPVRQLRLEGLSLAVANTPLRAGGFGAYQFEGAISADHVFDCSFRHLEIRNVAGQGIKISHGVRCEIAGNVVGPTGAGGVLARGSNVVVRDNAIQDVGRIYPSGIGLTCTGDDDQVRGNYIVRAPYVGLTCDGYRARIEGNRIEAVMQELHDGAGIYLGGTNHLIRSNFCFRIGQSASERRHAYYLDEHARDCTLESNLALECASPLHNHMATNNTIANNVFINHGDLRLAFYRCAAQHLEHNVVWASGKIEVFRPEAVDRWAGNILYSQAGIVLAVPVQDYVAGKPAPLEIEGAFTGQDPGIRVKDDGSIAWPKHSLARQLGVQPFEVRSNGQAARRWARAEIK